MQCVLPTFVGVEFGHSQRHLLFGGGVQQLTEVTHLVLCGTQHKGKVREGTRAKGEGKEIRAHLVELAVVVAIELHACIGEQGLGLAHRWTGSGGRCLFEDAVDCSRHGTHNSVEAQNTGRERNARTALELLMSERGLLLFLMRLQVHE